MVADVGGLVGLGLGFICLDLFHLSGLFGLFDVLDLICWGLSHFI